MILIRLTPNYELTDFDCGDEQLNNFLFEDAKPSLELRVANTFIQEDEGRIAAYFCILNDKVSKDEVIYLSAVPFYEKNGFLHLTKKDEDEHTRLMYFDMMEIAE